MLEVFAQVAEGKTRNDGNNEQTGLTNSLLGACPSEADLAEAEGAFLGSSGKTEQMPKEGLDGVTP